MKVIITQNELQQAVIAFFNLPEDTTVELEAVSKELPSSLNQPQLKRNAKKHLHKSSQHKHKAVKATKPEVALEPKQEVEQEVQQELKLEAEPEVKFENKPYPDNSNPRYGDLIEETQTEQPFSLFDESVEQEEEPKEEPLVEPKKEEVIFNYSEKLTVGLPKRKSEDSPFVDTFDEKEDSVFDYPQSPKSLF